MAKKKKITFNLVTNSSAKPIQVEGIGEVQLLFIRVAYDGKNTRFTYELPAGNQVYTSEDGKYYYEIIDDGVWNSGVLNLLEKEELFKDFSAKQKFIENIIRYEAEIIDIEDYQIRGIADRVSLYENPLKEVIEHEINSLLKNFLQDTLTYREYIQWEKEQKSYILKPLSKLPLVLDHSVFEIFTKGEDKIPNDLKIAFVALVRWIQFSDMYDKEQSGIELNLYNWLVIKDIILEFKNKYDVIKMIKNISGYTGKEWDFSLQKAAEWEHLVKNGIDVEITKIINESFRMKLLQQLISSIE